VRGRHLAAALAAFWPAFAAAQGMPGSATATLRVSFVVRPVLSISVDPEQIDFGDVPIESQNSFRAPTPLNIQVKSNAPWSLAGRVTEVLHRQGGSKAGGGEEKLPVLRLEHVTPHAPAAVLPNPGSASALILQGGDTGPDGAVSRPDVVVDVPAGADPGTYQMRVVFELTALP
jgi:hypothetical protein